MSAGALATVAGIAPPQPDRVFKFGLACGGTGGHIFPGLATAEVLRHQGHHVTLWLAGKDIESSAVQRWPGPKHTIQAQGFQGGVSLKAVGTASRLFSACRETIRLMSSDRPDALLAMGSYASVGPVIAALRFRVPVVLHESNVIPGRAIGAIGIASRGPLSSNGAGSAARRMANASLVLMLTEAAVGAGLVLFQLVADNASMARALFMAIHLVNTFLLVAAPRASLLAETGAESVVLRQLAAQLKGQS